MKTYQQRVDELEAQGLTNCEACDIAEGELLDGKIKAGSDPYAKQLLAGLGWRWAWKQKAFEGGKYERVTAETQKVKGS